VTDPRYLQSQPDSAAGFLQGKMSRFWNAALGYQKDAIVEIAAQGIECRFISTCPPDALPFHSIERGLPRYVGDTEAGFRSRLIHAHDIWETGDTPNGIIAELNRAGFANVTVDDNNDRPYEAPGHHPDGTPYAPGEEYWRFWVTIDDRIPELFGGVNTWGEFNWGEFNWGFARVPPNWQAVFKIIKKHKDADSICAGIDLLLSGANWGEFDWGDGTNWGFVLRISTGYR
jgi:hypothetical protein